MARKRLSIPSEHVSQQLEAVVASRHAGSESLSLRAPVARIAAEAAAEAALREVSTELSTLRSEGRVVLRLPLSAIVDSWLIRDRVVAEQAEMEALKSSLRSYGQRNPIEVADIGGGRYGLISGWRRMIALRALSEEDARFDTVLALVRLPQASGDTYIAMVEENEVRASLSYWERARVVVQTVSNGVFASEKLALQRLFASASRSKRSKIGSFIHLVHKLDGTLRFPSALPERLGLRLAAAFQAQPALAEQVIALLSQHDAKDAASEQACLLASLSGGTRSSATRDNLGDGLWLETKFDGRVVLGGPALNEELIDKLRAWLRDSVAK